MLWDLWIPVSQCPRECLVWKMCDVGHFQLGLNHVQTNPFFHQIVGLQTAVWHWNTIILISMAMRNLQIWKILIKLTAHTVGHTFSPIIQLCLWHFSNKHCLAMGPRIGHKSQSAITRERNGAKKKKTVKQNGPHNWDPFRHMKNVCPSPLNILAMQLRHTRL